MSDNGRSKRAFLDERFYYGRQRIIAGQELQDALSFVSQWTQLPVETVLDAGGQANEIQAVGQETVR